MGSYLLAHWPMLILLEATEIQDSQQKLKPVGAWAPVSLPPYSIGQNKPQSNPDPRGGKETPSLDGKS